MADKIVDFYFVAILPVILCKEMHSEATLQYNSGLYNKITSSIKYLSRAGINKVSTVELFPFRQFSMIEKRCVKGSLWIGNWEMPFIWFRNLLAVMWIPLRYNVLTWGSHLRRQTWNPHDCITCKRPTQNAKAFSHSIWENNLNGILALFLWNHSAF